MDDSEVLGCGGGGGGDRYCLLSMNGIAIHGWNMLMGGRDEMYGRCDGSSFHLWMAGIHQ